MSQFTPMTKEEVVETFWKKKNDQAHRQHLRYEKWKIEHAEAQQRALEFKAYWERRHRDDRDLWRDKDFANAVDKMSRAGYKGEHGNYEVPEEDKLKLDALYMQVTYGDFGHRGRKRFGLKIRPDRSRPLPDPIAIVKKNGNTALRCADEWKLLVGKTKVEAQNEFIRTTNKMLTRYGWNPPEGWV